MISKLHFHTQTTQMRPLYCGFIPPSHKKKHFEMRDSGLLLSCRCLRQEQAHLSCSASLIFMISTCVSGLFPLSSSAALLNDQTPTLVNPRRSEDAPLGSRVRHRARVRRGPRQVHQKCPEEKQNSLEAAAVNSEKVPRAASATSKRSLERWAFVCFIHLLYLFGKTRLNILHSGTICSLISEEEAGETA